MVLSEHIIVEHPSKTEIKDCCKFKTSPFYNSSSSERFPSFNEKKNT